MKIFCVGRNYVAHAQELGNEVPEDPVVFTKPMSALLKNNKAFYHPEFSNDIHFEVELVLRIGKHGRHIQEKFADRYIDGLAVGIDFTARDIQQRLKDKRLPWDLAKGFDGSAVLSEFIPAIEIDFSQPIEFGLKKNGEWVQKGSTDLMIFSFSKIISFLSQYFTLLKGDYIYTGTPAGVGPIKIGDVLEGYIGEQKMFQCDIK